MSEADHMTDGAEYYEIYGCDEEDNEVEIYKGLNVSVQNYRGIPLRLIVRKYDNYKAKRFTLNGTNQNVWIPNRHLKKDGTIKAHQNLDYIFRKARNQCRFAGIDVSWLR